MAGDWIKMRCNLWTHPKVVTLSSQLSVTRVTAIGALHGAWSIADQHADEDGRIEMSAAALDLLIETPGFCAALCRIGWMIDGGEHIQFTEYQSHNGSTGKSRADAQKRQTASRKRHNSVTETCDKTVTREEKRREDISPIVPKGDMQLKVEALMKRRVETPLGPKEQKAFKAASAVLAATSAADWLALEAYYKAPQEETFARKDLVTLLNNWNGEIDRAAKWAAKNATVREPELTYV